MKISEPFIYTGMQNQTLSVEVYIIDEVKREDIYVKTVSVKTEMATFKLRTEKDELRKIFDKVTQQLKEHDNVKVITRIINPIKLEQIGEFTQTIHGREQIFTLKFKIKN